MKIAVIGAGISGLGAAYLLSREHEVDLYEKESRLGGHANTHICEEHGRRFGVDTGFLVFNRPTYPLLTKLFETLDVRVENSSMTFGFWDQHSCLAYNCTGLKGLFFQSENWMSAAHWGMVIDMFRFFNRSTRDLKNGTLDENVTLGEYVSVYGEAFQNRFIIPMGAAIWSTPQEKMLDFPAHTFLRFFKNHGLLGANTQHQWETVSDGSIHYVNKISAHISGEIFLNCGECRFSRDGEGVTLMREQDSPKRYDKVIFATHAGDSLKMLETPTAQEQEILGSFSCQPNKAILHNDISELYPDKGVWSSWNYTTSHQQDNVVLTYWINRLQNLSTDREYLVTLNQDKPLNYTIATYDYEHPVFTREAITAQGRRLEISGQNHTYYCGAYWRYGFHEDGLWSANEIAKTFGVGL